MVLANRLPPTYLYSLRPSYLAPAYFMPSATKSPLRSLLSSLYNIDCLRRVQTRLSLKSLTLSLRHLSRLSL